MMKKVFILFILGCLVLPLEAQNTSTQGKEFWVSFMGNGFKTRYDILGGSFTWLRTQLIVSAKRDCHCTISNPNTGYEQSFFVGANSTYLFDDIPWEQAYMELEEYGQVLNKGLLVTADDTISVYCSNIAEMSFDASYVLPTQALGDDYIIQTYDQSVGSSYYSNYYTSAFVIVATEDGETTIDITPTVNTLEGHTAHNEYSITLYKGESYQVRSHNGYGSRDLSGTRVTARDCKKIAVFNGNNLTMVPDGGNDSDCVFEQAMPLKAWGKKFVVTASLGREKNDIVKITSAYDNNEILRNGTVLTTLNTGESIDFELRQTDKSCFIEASQSCAVYLFNHSKDDDIYFDDGPGAPSMVWIAPIEQRINDITFSTFNYESEHDTDISDHYVNVIVSADDIQHVYLDNELLSPLQFEPVNGAPQYRFFRKHIEHGTHHLACANGFNAHIYGFGHARGYAYMVGSNAKNLSSSLIINNEIVLPNETYTFCANQEVTFYANVNFNEYDLLWDFGDGTTSTENPASHIYNESLIYNASLLITTDEGGCTGSSSNTTNFIVDTRQQYIIENDEVCAGELYSGYGFNNVHINNDTILVRLQNNPIHSECQDSVLVYITSYPNYHIPFNDSRCWHGQPGVYDEHGFSFVYDQPGTYDRQLNLQTIDGCDSIISLHLIVDNQITYEFDTVTCQPFEWNNTTYITSGDYTYIFDTYSGCDSVVTCHLEVGGLIQGDTLHHPDCDSYIWYDTEYSETGFYSKELTTSLGCDSLVFLDLTLAYTPIPEKIQCTTPGAVVFGLPNADADTVAVVTNTEFFSFQYTFKVKESKHNEVECPWTHCDWTISKPSWSIEYDPTPKVTNGKYYSECTVYVAEHYDDYVILTATMSNACGSKQCKFYLKSSFLDIDEQSIFPSDFSVMPNPNNGKMTLNFVNMSGKIDIKVYDMRGILIDNIQAHIAEDNPSFNYDMNYKAKGLYLFVANGKEGTITKKVIVSP